MGTWGNDSPTFGTACPHHSGQRRWARFAWSLYPVFVTFVVVATANHYFTDVFLGALTAAVAATLAHRLLARARPDVWAFSQATA